MTQTEPRAWWHGCWLAPGHYLFDRDGRRVGRVGEPPCPFAGARWLDGELAPRRMPAGASLRIIEPPDGVVFTRMGRDCDDLRRHIESRSGEAAQGEFLLHAIFNCTVASWWDQTQGDDRPGCNSCLIVEGRHHAYGVIDMFPRMFPAQAARLAAAGVELRFLRWAS